MIPITPFKGEAQDITFEFENSCNCCCFGWRTKPPKPTTQVYVNSHGIAELFDHKKANDEVEALRRAMRNLNIVITQNAFQAEKDVSLVHFQISIAVGSLLDEEDPAPITIDLIQRINTAIHEIFKTVNQKIIL